MAIEKHLIVAYVARVKKPAGNETSTGCICFRRPDWILKSHLND